MARFSFFGFCFLFMMVSFTGLSQTQDTLILKRKVSVTARLLQTDPLGNVYLVKENNTLIRLNASGDSIGFFNEIRKGRIQAIDASNPLRILLFFADYNQVVILNNMLTQKTVLKLNTLGLTNVCCVANSADGNIWIYDAVSTQLLKVNERLDIIQSVNLRTLGENPLHPTGMVESDRWLYMADAEGSIRKYDLFGFYQNSYHFKTRHMQVHNDYLIYSDSVSLHSYHLKTLQERQISIPDAKYANQWRLERGQVYVLRDRELDIYELSSP